MITIIKTRVKLPPLDENQYFHGNHISGTLPSEHSQVRPSELTSDIYKWVKYNGELASPRKFECQVAKQLTELDRANRLLCRSHSPYGMYGPQTEPPTHSYCDHKPIPARARPSIHTHNGPEISSHRKNQQSVKSSSLHHLKDHCPEIRYARMLITIS